MGCRPRGLCCPVPRPFPKDKGQRVTDKADVTEGQVVPPPTAPSFWLECLPLCPGLLQVTPDHNPSRDSQKKKIVMQAPEEVLSPHAHAHARRKWETLAFRKVSPIWIFAWPKRERVRKKKRTLFSSFAYLFYMSMHFLCTIFAFCLLLIYFVFVLFFFLTSLRRWPVSRHWFRASSSSSLSFSYNIF